MMSPRPSMRRIQEAVAAEFGLCRDDLVGPSRARDITAPRHIAMRLCRELTGASFSRIGMAFGVGSHRSVSDAVQKIGEAARVSPELAARLAMLAARVAAPTQEAA